MNDSRLASGLNGGIWGKFRIRFYRTSAYGWIPPRGLGWGVGKRNHQSQSFPSLKWICCPNASILNAAQWVLHMCLCYAHIVLVFFQVAVQLESGMRVNLVWPYFEYGCFSW